MELNHKKIIIVESSKICNLPAQKIETYLESLFLFLAYAKNRADEGNAVEREMLDYMVCNQV